MFNFVKPRHLRDLWNVELVRLLVRAVVVDLLTHFDLRAQRSAAARQGLELIRGGDGSSPGVRRHEHFHLGRLLHDRLVLYLRVSFSGGRPGLFLRLPGFSRGDAHLVPPFDPSFGDAVLVLVHVGVSDDRDLAPSHLTLIVLCSR